MRTLTESMGQTTEDIEILLIVSSSGTRKGCFQKKKKKKKKKKWNENFHFKIHKNATFYPKN